MNNHHRINSWWYKPSLNWLSALLLPLSYLFRLIIFFRQLAYRFNWLSSTQLSVPVIVVGNITVGGTGKTPFVIWLVQFLQRQGYKPGVISRGYQGNYQESVRLVNHKAQVEQVGEEPFLIFYRTQTPVVVGKNRVEAAQYLLEQTDCDIIISDDGLQHYALSRDLEIVMVDGYRRFGNQQCLPAGPLREPLARLKSADLVVVTDGSPDQEAVMKLVPQSFVSCQNPTYKIDQLSFKTKIVHAVAGIGNPERFFQTLRAMRLRIFEHPFPDHYQYSQSDFQFGEDAIVLMTEKDAVKCFSFAEDNYYYLQVEAQLPEGFGEKLLRLL